MTYWRTETLQHRLPVEGLIDPYVEERVENCAYELSMGPEAFITSRDDKKKIVLDERESLVIPPGQFALLLTEERVIVPTTAIAFISMRFGLKKRGLVNVSGFHVDPGFSGRLKFSVYNAGSRDITISRGDRAFLIWYANLDGETADGYGDAGEDQDHITSADQNIMHGEVASPGELRKELEQVKHFYENNKWLLGVICAAVLGILVRLFFMGLFTIPTPADLEAIKAELREELLQELTAKDGAGGDNETPASNGESAPDGVGAPGRATSQAEKTEPKADGDTLPH